MPRVKQWKRGVAGYDVGIFFDGPRLTEEGGEGRKRRRVERRVKKAISKEAGTRYGHCPMLLSQSVNVPHPSLEMHRRGSLDLRQRAITT
jgi:hypothetical protein